MNRNHLRNRRGFTLVELLVVIGIIGVLVSILVPVAGRIRQAGYKTDTANQLNVIRTAIEMYHQTFQAYPGPFSNQDVCTEAKVLFDGSKVTMAENLVLGLLGGIEQRPNDKAPRYDFAWVGTGPRSLVASNPKRYDPFLTTSGWISDGQFREAETGRIVCQDSRVPEFVDRYPAQPMPVLYLRARLGAPGIINGANSKELYQYDIRQITPYTSNRIYGNVQGLQKVGNDMSVAFNKSSLADALPYFKNATLCPDKEKDQTKGTPRAKDGFILISAGQDRIYGTADDITSFGNVGE
ncbi:MAG: type II secretion system protein [Bacillota bacterium]